MNKKTPMQERPSTVKRKQDLLKQICVFVDENLDKSITLQMLAEQFGVSVSTVTQLFQRRANTTFHRFVTQRRMAEAEKLIAKNMPLEEVGKHVGYTDHSSFYRAFKQCYGVSPREYKLNQKV